ncbi:MAG: hypothetical protein COZ16_12260 [Flavobacteriaceae bacterium CG_4_10_14_3_um_filter_31_253]|nr:MAG: hypothetical protein COZ16_12260 [Flavobacteriaceae bacterium CG_4_10_14_3_um_filter_31_253]
MKKLILSDESINSYGYRVLTKGIDLSAYKKNPVVLYNHNRYQGLVGKGVDVGIVGNQLVAKEIEFYEGNEYAADIKRKYEQGFLNAFSIGIQILETSDDPKDLLKGQRYATVTKSKLVEFSIVEMPSNSNAVRLYDENMQELSISDLTILSNPLETVDLALPKKVEEQNKNLISMKNLLQKLGLADNATEEQAIEALVKLQNQTKTLSEGIAKVCKKLGAFENEPEKEQAFQKLAASDLDSALVFLSAPAKKEEAKKEQSTTEQVSLSDVLKSFQGLSQEKPKEEPKKGSYEHYMQSIKK